MIGYVRSFESNMTMSFKIRESKLLKKYNQIWKKDKSFSNIKFHGEPVFGDNDKCVKTKRKIYGGEVNRDFQGKEVPREKASYKFLSLIMLYSVVQAKKK